MPIKNTRRRRRTSYSPTRRKGTRLRRRTSYSPTRRKRRSSPLVLPSSWASSVDRLPQSNRGYRGKIKKEWPKPVPVTPKNIASLFGWKTVFPKGTVLIYLYNDATVEKKIVK